MLKRNETTKNFKLISVKHLEELHAELYEMEHEPTGAKLCWLNRDEENKTYGIAFRTIPDDDTGVFHILEHSLLCGSEHYPVKRPIVEMMKSSMNTFLNAMTYPDKTYYPVSSRNDQDFLNLIRVHTDAVFYPLIRKQPEIFKQEAWHYEFEDGQMLPFYSGVVLNEMRGMSASPDILLTDEIERQLFPDTCYRFTSGGSPAKIPQLSYEKFLEVYEKHYHPSNSYIFLDGRMDIETVLELLDTEYLSHYTKQDMDIQILKQLPVNAGTTELFYELSEEEDLEGRTRLAWGFVIGDYTSREEMTATMILSEVLCGSNQSPLKRRLLENGLAEDVTIELMGSTLQPYLMLDVQNVEKEHIPEIREIVRDELERCACEGLDPRLLESAMSQIELSMKERDFGSTPQGVEFGAMVLESWLYGGAPEAPLLVAPIFESLRAKQKEGYFEEFIRGKLLENQHRCEIILYPSHTEGARKRQAEEEKISQICQTWTEKDWQKKRNEAEQLSIWQNQSDSEEALKTIPRLTLADIGEVPKVIPTKLTEIDGIPLLRHSLPAEVTYWNLYFDISALPMESLSAAAFLCSVLGETDTQTHSLLELEIQKGNDLGDLTFSVDPFCPVNAPEKCRTYLHVSYGALEERAVKAAKLVAEILTQTILNNAREIEELLLQLRAQTEEDLTANGHQMAALRIFSSVSAVGAVQEYTSGFTFCKWLKEHERNFETCSQTYCEELRTLCDTIFRPDALTVSSVGASSSTERAVIETLLGSFPKLPESKSHFGYQPDAKRMDLFTQKPKSEGIAITGDVSFAVMGGNLKMFGGCYTGGAKVASRILSLSYLWDEIRVQGGAYGANLILGESGNTAFYSYRDPNPNRSLAKYREAGHFLEEFAAENPDLPSYIIGTIAGTEPFLLPRAQAQLADGWYFSGLTYEKQCEIRRSMLKTSQSDLMKLKDALSSVSEQGICVAGPREQLEKCGLKHIYTL